MIKGARSIRSTVGAEREARAVGGVIRADVSGDGCTSLGALLVAEGNMDRLRLG